MAFFNYVNPWPETRNHPLASPPLLSLGLAPGDGMPPCGRADFGPEISCGTTCLICAPRPAAGSLSRRSWRLALALAQNEILLHNGFVFSPNGLGGRGGKKQRDRGATPTPAPCWALRPVLGGGALLAQPPSCSPAAQAPLPPTHGGAQQLASTAVLPTSLAYVAASSSTCS
jgi:hypothetical protein